MKGVVSSFDDFVAFGLQHGSEGGSHHAVLFLLGRFDESLTLLQRPEEFGTAASEIGQAFALRPTGSVVEWFAFCPKFGLLLGRHDAPNFIGVLVFSHKS